MNQLLLVNGRNRGRSGGVTRATGRREYSSNKYSSSVLLPVTSFPLRGEPQTADQIAQRAEHLYKLQDSLEGRPLFVLHDGPPYANGNLHMGHAMNKILKDIVNRYKLMKGYKINYIPGWDCHGLPIELKVLELEKKTREDMNPITLRQKARSFAEQNIEQQRQSFRSWGIMADWSAPYKTMDPSYEAKQIGIFLQMFKKGGLKPVYWSPSTRTALAESELEYNEDHKSPSIFVAFPVSKWNTQSGDISAYSNLHALIWTTTPWTIPANLAISVNPTVQYCIVHAVSSDRHYIIAADRLEYMRSVLQTELITKATLSEGVEYVHPLNGRTSKIICGGHVTTQSGTGLVHIAPGHGMDDFEVCKRNGISEILCPVDHTGRFTQEAGQFEGLNVLTDGNKALTEALSHKGVLVSASTYQHKYPYDWRSKKPIIIRATKQWFANLRDIQPEAVNAAQEVSIVPSTARKRLLSNVTGRDDWCISRQRPWGVPIPAFFHKQTDEPLLTTQSIEHIQRLIEQHGTDCWWTMSVNDLLADQYKERSGDYVKGTDTMDVWFDSGTSWASVIEGKGLPLPVEGTDQHRGWFQSSLLTCIAASGKAPYKSVVTHGFVLDEQGRKMSKSLGNIIEPSTVVNGGKDKKKDPPYGVDVLRTWVAYADFTKEVEVGPITLTKSTEAIKKIRNTIRFCLANLADFTPSDAVSYAKLSELDQFMLHKLYVLATELEQCYDTLAFYSVLRHLGEFCINDASTFYFEITKDRLYTEAINSPLRRNCQTVLNEVYQVLMKGCAPIASNTAEEVYKHAPIASKMPSLFLEGWIKKKEEWNNQVVGTKWTTLRAVRNELNKRAENHRTQTSLPTAQMEATIYVPDRLFTLLTQTNTEDLAVVFGVAKVAVVQATDTTISNLGEASLAQIVLHDQDDQRIDFHIVLSKTGILYSTVCNLQEQRSSSALGAGDSSLPLLCCVLVVRVF